MKKRRQLYSLILAFALMFSLTATVRAEAQTVETSDGPCEAIEEVISSYFALREKTMSPGIEIAESTLADEFSALSGNQEFVDSEVARRDFGLYNLANKHGVHVVNYQISGHIESIEEIRPSVVEVKAHEWNWVRYNDGKGGPIDEMGYGIEHVITLEEQENGTYQILGDTYDEYNFLGAPEEKNMVLPVIEDAVIENVQTAAFSSTGVNSSVALDINALISYADRWVPHNTVSDSSPHPEYYNKDTYGYYDQDCANYVSQCLRAGGMEFDNGDGDRSNTNWDGTQWWFDTGLLGNQKWENYNSCPPSWRAVGKFTLYWTKQGYADVLATDTTVIPGNPVYIGTNHVGICVGYNSAGIPILNAHTTDVYHVPYTNFGSSARTIQIRTVNCVAHQGGYSHDSVYHWRVCTVCGVLDKTQHNFVFYGTYYKCSDCNYKTTSPEGTVSIEGPVSIQADNGAR